MQATICSNFFITTDKISSYVPVLSTVTNLVDLFQKYVVLPQMREEDIWQNHYYTHLDQKSISRCLILLVPVFGNVFVAVLDYLNRRWNNREWVLEIVAQYGECLEHAEPWLQDDKDVVLAAVQRSSKALEFASERLKRDPEFMFALMLMKTDALEFMSDQLKNTKESMLEFVKQDGLALQYASDKLRSDRDVILAAVQQNGLALKHASIQLKNDKDVISAAMKQNSAAGQFIGEQLKNDKEFMFPYVKQDGALLEYAGDELKDDPQVVLTAIEKKWWALGFASPKLRSDKEFMLTALETNCFALKDTDTPLKGDAEFILSVMERRNKWAVADASDSLKNDQCFMVKAIKYDISVVMHLSYRLRDDREFMLAISQISGIFLAYASRQLMGDRAFILAAMKEVGEYLLPYLSAKFQDDKEIMLTVIKQHGWAIEYASPRLRMDPDLIQAAVQKNSNAAIFAIPTAVGINALRPPALDVLSPTTLKISQFPIMFRSGCNIFTGPAPTYFKDQAAFLMNEIRTVFMLTEADKLDHLMPPDFYAKHGIELIHFPIKDREAPSSPEEMLTLTDKILEQTTDGKNIYVHCLGGKGRTGTVMACLTRRLYPEMSGEEAIQFTRKAIPGAIETKEQEEFVKAFNPGK